MENVSNVDEMLLINKRQKLYYEDIKDGNLVNKGNFLTQLWRKARRSQQAFRTEIKVNEYIYSLHNEWLGDLRNKAVLDLGCYDGNHLSLSIAQKAKYYLGIDLSEPATEILANKLRNQNIKNAYAKAVDFLSAEFQQEYKGKFDVIYAHSVLHHFKYFDDLLLKCHSILKEDGYIISLDPLQTNNTMNFIRYLYRPFQSDKDWEYPFKKESLAQIKKYFKIENVQGMMGKTKLAIPLFFINKKLGLKVAGKFFNHDKAYANNEGKALYDCLQITMKLKRIPF
ncbi:class I SAM-dependent methyltransferase [Pontibacter vulgaris]|uniref:class I SAM-dependent methyltransferase n=1 Tax=Pontibacter vulgaris TaxID=2905679 RepID=UPI001FA6B190|nr:class I SAM-dependent methyltransferase [Pontibacter vulgaris]